MRGRSPDSTLLSRYQTLFASSMGRPATIGRSGYGFGPYLNEPGSSDQSTACSKTRSWRPGLTPVSRSVLCWSPRCATTGGDQIESKLIQRAPRSPQTQAHQIVVNVAPWGRNIVRTKPLHKDFVAS